MTTRPRASAALATLFAALFAIAVVVDLREIPRGALPEACADLPRWEQAGDDARLDIARRVDDLLQDFNFKRFESAGPDAIDRRMAVFEHLPTGLEFVLLPPPAPAVADAWSWSIPQRRRLLLVSRGVVPFDLLEPFSDVNKRPGVVAVEWTAASAWCNSVGLFLPSCKESWWVYVGSTGDVEMSPYGRNGFVSLGLRGVGEHPEWCVESIDEYEGGVSSWFDHGGYNAVLWYAWKLEGPPRDSGPAVSVLGATWNCSHATSRAACRPVLRITSRDGAFTVERDPLAPSR